MNQELFTIRQLAETAGVTQRTIRYYTDEGLIDAPVDRVRMPRYTRRHLLQLMAAARLKANFLPLRVIRAKLAGLDDEQLQEIINSEPQPINELVDAAVMAEAVADHQLDQILTSSTTITTGETNQGERRWYRYIIDDGIELHFRDDQMIDNGELRRISAILRRHP
jgi:DNA-binding transcriptional MerR regulator